MTLKVDAKLLIEEMAVNSKLAGELLEASMELVVARSTIDRQEAEIQDLQARVERLGGKI
jgi:capsule polysaccharide export protein KpsE/RkpR